MYVQYFNRHLKLGNKDTKVIEKRFNQQLAHLKQEWDDFFISVYESALSKHTIVKFTSVKNKKKDYALLPYIELPFAKSNKLNLVVDNEEDFQQFLQNEFNFPLVSLTSWLFEKDWLISTYWITIEWIVHLAKDPYYENLVFKKNGKVLLNLPWKLFKAQGNFTWSSRLIHEYNGRIQMWYLNWVQDNPHFFATEILTDTKVDMAHYKWFIVNQWKKHHFIHPLWHIEHTDEELLALNFDEPILEIKSFRNLLDIFPIYEFKHSKYAYLIFDGTLVKLDTLSLVWIFNIDWKNFFEAPNLIGLDIRNFDALVTPSIKSCFNFKWETLETLKNGHFEDIVFKSNVINGFMDRLYIIAKQNKQGGIEIEDWVFFKLTPYHFLRYIISNGCLSLSFTTFNKTYQIIKEEILLDEVIPDIINKTPKFTYNSTNGLFNGVLTIKHNKEQLFYTLNHWKLNHFFTMNSANDLGKPYEYLINNKWFHFIKTPHNHFFLNFKGQVKRIPNLSSDKLYDCLKRCRVLFFKSWSEIINEKPFISENIGTLDDVDLSWTYIFENNKKAIINWNNSHLKNDRNWQTSLSFNSRTILPSCLSFNIPYGKKSYKYTIETSKFIIKNNKEMLNMRWKII